MTDIQVPDLPPYTFDLYQSQSMRTAKDMGSEADLIHAALGLASEAGEFCDAIKKSFAYEKELDIENLMEELGDLMWFTALACNALGVPMQTVAVSNVAKLLKRYPEAFTNDDALARADKVGEGVN